MKIIKSGFLYSLIVSLFSLAFYACSPASPKLKPEPLVPSEKVVSANNEAFRRPAVDILFVVDDSGSMSSHQANVARNMDQFLNEFTKLKLIDYHIGVISTDTASTMRQGSSGQLARTGGYSFVDRNTPNGIQVVKRNVSLGSSGSGWEKMFDPIVMALTLPVIDGHNKGFYRPDAYLVIIFVTDTEDQDSINDPQSTMDFLVSLKKDKNKILSYAAYIPQSSASCFRDDPNRGILEHFLSLNVNAGNNLVSLCDPAFGTKLVEFSKEIIQVVNKPIILSRPPVVSTIKVMYGTQEIPSDPLTGWTFAPEKNAIVFGRDLKLDDNQPEGTGIDITFDSAYYPEEAP